MSFGIGMNFGLTGEPVTVDRPSTGEPEDWPLGNDLDAVITAATTAGSRLIVTLRRCVNSPIPDVEIDSVAGLLRVTGVPAPTAADGSVVRTSATSVTVHLAAAAFKSLRIGDYQLALEEVTIGGRRLLKHKRLMLAYRTAGGLR